MSKAYIVKNMPHACGCYLFKDEKGEIIYVGKAKDQDVERKDDQNNFIMLFL